MRKEPSVWLISSEVCAQKSCPQLWDEDTCPGVANVSNCDGQEGNYKEMDNEPGERLV